MAIGSSCRRRDDLESGFTLSELLVVIAILGILSAIVVFSVRGVSDKGLTEATATDVSVLRTAEEAYRSQNGSYATAAQLQSAGFLATLPTLDNVDPLPKDCSATATCTSFVVGTTGGSQPAGGATFLNASNTTPPFSFMQDDFQRQNGGQQVTFSQGASGTLATTANTPGNTAALFASADEANVNAVILSTATVPAGSAGTCATSGSVSCPGVASSKTQYTNGNLVVFACKSGGATLVPATGAPTCKAPSGGYLSGSNVPTTVSQLVSLLQANPTWQLAIADPKGTNHEGNSGPPSAPYGYAAFQALTAATSAGGGGLTSAQYIAMQNSTPKQIVFGSNVTTTQTDVVTGTVQFALIPESFVVSPFGNDTNSWSPVPSCTGLCSSTQPPGPTGLYDAIRQWAVVLGNATPAQQSLATRFIQYVTSARGQAIMAQYGYSPIS